LEIDRLGCRIISGMLQAGGGYDSRIGFGHLP
jgi:hypothetical protein